MAELAKSRGRQRRGLTKDANFRAKFGLPEEERVIDDFSCAIQKEVLLHGRLYVSAQYMCFYSKIFGHKTMEVMPFAQTIAIEKRNTSLFIPNAIEITFKRANGPPCKRFFTSFKDRDAAITTLTKLWGEHRAGGQPPPSPATTHPSKSKPAPAPVPESEPEPEPEPEPRAPLSSPHSAGSGATIAERPVEDEIDMMLVADENQEKIDMSELVSFTLENCRSCADFFEEFFSDSSDYTVQFREQRGDTATELTAWQRSTSLGHTRTVRFISPVKAAIGPKTTAAEETQRYQLSESGNSLVVQAEAIFPNVPYGECFKVVTQYTISRLREAPVDSVKIVISSGIRWLKSTWWESLIKDGTLKENTESFKLWQLLATARWAERVERLRDGGDASPGGTDSGGPPTVSSMLITSSHDSKNDKPPGCSDEETSLQKQSPEKAPLPFRPPVSAATGTAATSAPVTSERKVQSDTVSPAAADDIIVDQSSGLSASVVGLLQSQWLVVGLAGVILVLLFVVNWQMEQISDLSAALAASRATAGTAGTAAVGQFDRNIAGVDSDGDIPCPAACAAGLSS
eukprot:COSAG02_NODE_1570_length_11893_cov_2.376717_12_plen_571_part_00